MHNKIKIQTCNQDKNQRLDVFLVKKLKKLSRSYIKRLINKNNILIDNIALKAKYKIKGNEHIKLIIPKRNNSYLQAEKINLEIIFEDHDIIVINKPAGIAMYPGRGIYNGTLANGLIYHFPNIIDNSLHPGIVHRLDKNTSGVLVCGKNKFATTSLKNIFKQRKITKIYHAFCIGIFKTKNFSLKTPHMRDEKNRIKFTTKPKYKYKLFNNKYAYSNFKVLEHNQNITELYIKILTGRTHQIRAQLSDIGHPILGDFLYGNNNYFNKIKNSNIRNIISKLTRHALHAQKIGFEHPRTKQYIEFEADLPNDLKNLKNIIKKS